MSPRDPFDELKQSEKLITPLPGGARAKHLLAIDKVLAGRTVVPLRRRASTVLRWVAATVVILGLLLPSAVVVAADSLPGDILYPLKRATEPLLAVFDDEVVARHRIDEVVGLRDQDRPAEKALEDATRAVDDLPSDSPLRDRLTDLRPTTTTIRTRATNEAPTPRDTTVPRTTVVSDEPTDDRTTTTSTRPPTDRTTTTLAGDSNTDR